jgi:hypothetical protein
MALIQRYSTSWRPNFRLLDELERRGLWHREGETQTEPVPLRQSVDEYVESFHARASLSWERLTPEDATAFDTELRRLVRERIGETVEQAVRTWIAWGKPQAGIGGM